MAGTADLPPKIWLSNTADLCDRFGDAVRVCCTPLVAYGGRRAAIGPIACMRTFEDAGLLRGLLERPGQGRILVVDGGASTRVALLGEKMARLGQGSGWAGVLIRGAVRDVEALRQIDFGVFAIAKVPMRGGSSGAGEAHAPVTFDGLCFTPGDILCMDADGVVIVPGGMVASA